MKRGIALFLALVLILGTLPATAFATGGVFDEANDGSAERPFQIADAEDLIAFAEMVNDPDQDQKNACAELLGNIDMTGKNWVSISPQGGYGGTFNGNNFTITIDITADENYADPVALFGFLQRGTVKNLNVAGKLTVTADYANDMYFSPLVAMLGYRGTVENCSSGVEINVDFADMFGAAGIVSYVSDEAVISGCSNWGTITATGADSEIGVGGIVGWADSSAVLENCYNRAAITVSGDATAYVGGLVGFSASGPAKLVGCYSSATAEDNVYVNPSWAERTGLITWENGMGSDFLGVGYELDGDSANCMSVSEAIDGEGNLYYMEYGFRRAQDFETAEQAKDFLNGDSGSAYVLSDELGDGWPVLAWELEKPISQDTEQGKALAAVKKAFAEAQKAALDALDNGKTIDGAKYVGYNTYTYRQNNSQNDYYRYSDENWELLTAYYSTAKKELNVGFAEPEGWESMEPEAITADGERQAARLTEIGDTALKNMAAVLTVRAEKEFAGKKLTAQQNIYTTYKKQLYALDTDRGMLSAVWHELPGTNEASEQLETMAKTLEQTLADGLAALEATRTQAALDAAKAEWNAKLLAVRGSYSVPAIDSGVADKWDGTAKTQPAGSGTQADPYRIGTGAELAWFAEKVNGGSTSACAVLTADIDLNRQEWTSIGTKNKPYMGTFDGQNHIIHGIWSTDESNTIQGLFGYIGQSNSNRSVYGTVKNVKAAGRIRAVQSAGSGLIAGSNAGEIYNCEVSAFLGSWKGISAIGGIAGSLTGGSVENCRTYGLYLATDDSQYSGKIVNSIGGIVGAAGASEPSEGCLIRYCENHMRLRGYELSYLGGKGSSMGGIVGLISGIAKVRESVNYAEVRGELRVGGILGYVIQDSNAQLDYVTNYGDVYGASASNPDTHGTGGIVGYADEKTTFCLQYAYNAGTIYGETKRNQYNAAYEYSATAPMTGALVGNWRAGDVQHAQSSSADNTLWGYAAATGTNGTDTMRVGEITPTVNVKGGMWEKLTATRTLLGKLIRVSDRDENYKIYGTQTKLYNDTVMQCVRKVELCTTAEEIDAALEEAEKTLAEVPTELAAAKAALREEMHAFVDGNLYDAENKKTIDGLLAEADAALDAAKKLSDVTDVRQTYLGSENIDGKLKEVETYPIKAANGLYNEFIYGKKYSQEDAAALLRAYEGWRLKLDGAKTVEEVERLYAEARKVLTELVKGFAEGDTAPDPDQAAQDALKLARQEILDELAALEKKYADALTGQAGDLTALAERWQKAIQAVLDESKSDLHTAATPALDEITSYAELEALRQSAAQKLEDVYEAAQRELTNLLASARNADAWDGETVTQPEQKDGVYQIGTPAELAWLAKSINDNTVSASAKAVLTADIDLGYCEWTPIGQTSGRAYRGSLDGQGHTVSGLYISKAGSGYAGLIGLAYGGTKVSNLTVRGEIALADVGKVSVGGVAADVSAGEFENCVSDVKIAITRLTNSNANLGGFTGVASATSFTDCRFEGSITCQYTGSGYLGRGYSSYSGGALGGFIGLVKYTTLERCVNSGDVTVNKASGVGGIAGRIYASGDDETRLHECLNTGHISNDVNFVIGTGEWPAGGIGGIVGVTDGMGGSLLIDTCYNTGVISGGIIAGGILGGESGSYGKTTSTGSEKLVVKNCYNAGVLDTGTKVDHIGTLAGFPIDGRYCDNLYVLSGTARAALGWKSSQGDRIYAVDMLTADIFDGLLESIADLNGGYPIFPWQLLLENNREAVIAYLNEYYHTNVESLISDAQRTALEAMLGQTAETIRTAADAQSIVDAYHAALEAMNPEKLLDEARAAVLRKLTEAYEAAKTAYPAIEAGLTERYTSDCDAITKSANAAQAETVVDGFAAHVVDLLVAAAQGAPMKELAGKAEEIEAAYAALTEAQQALVQDYAKLTDIQALAALYAKDLDLLKQWASEDKAAYPDLEEKLTGLSAQAQEKLGNCTRQEELAPVLDGYCADVVRMLLADVGFAAGTTTMGELDEAAEKLERTRRALNGLTEAQKALLEENSEQMLEAAEELLAVYRKAAETVEAWAAEDAASYPQIAEAVQTLAEAAKTELLACTDKDGAVLALGRYCANIAGALIDDLAFTSGETTMAEVKENALKTARAAYDALTEEQKALVPEEKTAALEAAEKLLADYRKAADDLKAQRAKDQVKYPALGDRIGALADAAAAELGACTSQEDTQKVMDRYCAQVADLLIEQIGTLPEKPTEESLAELNRNLRRARERYDALTDAQKQYVTRLEELKAAEEYYRTAEVEKPTEPSQPQKPEDTKPTEPGASESGKPTEPAETDDEAVKAVSDLIHAIGEVTLERKDAIEAALDAFNALTDAQKALLPAEDKAALDAAVAAYQALLDGQTPSEEPTEPGEPKPEDENRGFDWTIVWLIAGILGAAALIFGLVKWFLAAKRAKEK
jgi:hypothetical protein